MARRPNARLEFFCVGTREFVSRVPARVTREEAVQAAVPDVIIRSAGDTPAATGQRHRAIEGVDRLLRRRWQRKSPKARISGGKSRNLANAFRSRRGDRSTFVANRVGKKGPS